MNMRECIAQAQREMGFSEKRIMLAAEYADFKNPETVKDTLFPIVPHLERKFIDIYKASTKGECDPQLFGDVMLECIRAARLEGHL